MTVTLDWKNPSEWGICTSHLRRDDKIMFQWYVLPIFLFFFAYSWVDKWFFSYCWWVIELVIGSVFTVDEWFSKWLGVIYWLSEWLGVFTDWDKRQAVALWGYFIQPNGDWLIIFLFFWFCETVRKISFEFKLTWILSAGNSSVQ